MVASRRDAAGMNIARALVDTFGFAESAHVRGHTVFEKEDIRVVLVEEDAIDAEHLGELFSPEYYVFVSRHTSSMGIPSLTAHFPGNFSKDAAYGGRPRELAYAHPPLLKAFFQRLWNSRHEAQGYQVAIEATHHGPTGLDRPVLFAEIGSSEKEWGDRKAARILAHTIMDTFNSPLEQWPIGIGFGGPHYSDKFAQLVACSQYAVGAIASKHTLGSLDPTMLSQMISKCVGKVEIAFVDWKGLGSQKTVIMRMIEDAGLRAIRL